MKNIFLLLIICILFSCTGKQDDDIDEALITEQQLSKDDLNYRDYIDNYDTNLIMHFDNDGNFTNSGNKEIIVFYRDKREIPNLINCAVIFVLCPENEKVLSSYRIPDYWTLPFDPGDLLPMENLGRNIFWRNAIIGYIGDFNENGKEEIYLYRVSGMGADLYIFEFDGREFINITEKDYKLTYYIVDADEENKIIKLLDIYNYNEYFIKWNNITQRYEEI
ncbi:MAG: hypothetical protein FWD28_07555 [Treponema sp.]|nr:hypothetical protein [Treponema sp.]